MTKIYRRAFLLGASTLSMFAWLPTLGNAQSGIDANEAERMLDLNMVQLEDQLVKGLRLTTADQKQYIQGVLLAVKMARFREPWSTSSLFGHASAIRSSHSLTSESLCALWQLAAESRSLASQATK